MSHNQRFSSLDKFEEKNHCFCNWDITICLFDIRVLQLCFANLRQTRHCGLRSYGFLIHPYFVGSKIISASIWSNFHIEIVKSNMLVFSYKRYCLLCLRKSRMRILNGMFYNKQLYKSPLHTVLEFLIDLNIRIWSVIEN